MGPGTDGSEECIPVALASTPASAPSRSLSVSRRSARTACTPFALSLMSTLLLAACGGGGSESETNPLPDLAAAVAAREGLPVSSPGYLVPAGQSRLSVPLSNCSLTQNRTTTITGDGTLEINTDGTVVFTARTSTQSSPEEVLRISLADTTSRVVGATTNSTGTTTAEMGIYHRLALASAQGELEVSSVNNLTGRLDVLQTTREFTCDLPVNAFTLPDTISAQRLAQLTDGATPSADNLLDEDNLYVGTNSTTWHTAFGLPYDDLDRTYAPYRFARFVRLERPGSAAGSNTAALSVSESLNGTYVAIEPAPRRPGAAPFTAEYREEYRLYNGSNTPEITVRMSQNHATPSASTPSYEVRFSRQGNAFRPNGTLQTTPFSYLGVMGLADGTPNMFFRTGRRLPLSNCSNGAQSGLARSMLFDDMGRVLWLDAQGNLLAAFNPSDTDFQERSLGLSGNAITSEFKVYASAFDQTRGNTSSRLSLHTGIGTVTVSYGNTSETCDAPAVQNPPNQYLNSRFNSFLNYGGNSYVDTNTSSYTCQGDNGATSWRHRLNNTGELFTETTLPGGSTNVVQWSGGTGWFNATGASYTETYTVSGSNSASVASQLIHPATTVRQGCFSGVAITPINGVAALRSSP